MSEVIFPLVSIYSGSVFSSNCFGPVLGPDIDRDDFVNKRAEAPKAISKHALVIAEGDTETQ